MIVITDTFGFVDDNLELLRTEVECRLSVRLTSHYHGLYKCDYYRTAPRSHPKIRLFPAVGSDVYGHSDVRSLLTVATLNEESSDKTLKSALLIAGIRPMVRGFIDVDNSLKQWLWDGTQFGQSFL